jgi:ubiquinone biosynthesis protein UbiJ
MTTDIFAVRQSLRAAMTDPRRTFKQQMVAAQQLVASALAEEPSFRLPTAAERAEDDAFNDRSAP